MEDKVHVVSGQDIMDHLKNALKEHPTQRLEIVSLMFPAMGDSEMAQFNARLAREKWRIVDIPHVLIRTENGRTAPSALVVIIEKTEEE